MTMTAQKHNNCPTCTCTNPLPERSFSELNGLLCLPMPEGMQRVESGSLQFGDDWPGAFIRGDNAAYYSMALDHLLGGAVDPMTLGILSGLNELLKSSKAT